MSKKKIKKILTITAWVMGAVVIGIAIYGLFTAKWMP